MAYAASWEPIPDDGLPRYPERRPQSAAMGMPMPTYDDVVAARERISPHLRETPFFTYPALSALVGTEVWVKHENHQPVGCVQSPRRGQLVAQLTDRSGRAA